ncbi:cystathionine beta-lyase [Pseudomonas fragariae (ex Marin et al. 2024)]|uniref:Cystathionine beta-lyase n=1 Tax=Pseudomonas syringae pv. apii TaxID=81036 RepID=A0A3M5WXF9_9PSED|nr:MULTISPECIES: cystathionine beta-lyase [Pseudomonas syringae group]AKF44222.1 cystathionine beta-lyase, bacterial [Pseudomonas syringae pv. syringae B301D]EXL29282.1 Cystathionine beta-lyase [Pseudomonas syringae pv. syringae str. B301D-R]MCH5509667.1 cystathionine beta-lyase [Pseudomonas syringae pv. syringae]MCH5638123.1 cystathionine beta-lyase [Pseudomonas syringae pv. syringae]MCH7427237.1 cystathionine beta-lyase [Pseudomonas syringae pv. syringae]
MPQDKDPRAHTALSQRGRSAGSGPGIAVNPPVVRLSTVLFDSLESLRQAEIRTTGPERSLTYGANGNPTAFALQDLISELEGAHGTCLYPTGLAAVAQMFQSFLRPGDHVLITESVYGPVRRLAKTMLTAFDIQFDFYAADGSNVESLLKANTRMIYAEVPGSLTFDMCDLPALSQLCKARNLLLAVDNSWGSGVLYKPLELGADISLMALTKYVAGHSDVMMGSVSTTEAHWHTLKTMNTAVGNTVSPDDAYLVLRGARSLAARMAMHERHALQIAQWLQAQPQVARVLYPALPDDPGHAIWKRDFHGCNGLLSFEFNTADRQVLDRFTGALKLFGIGYSWGGFESLITEVEQHGPERGAGPMLRLQVGLESPEDLIADLRNGFAAE